MRIGVRAFGRCSIVLMALACAHAHAEQPVHIPLFFDFTLKATFTSSVCGFDVFRHIVGTFVITGIKRDGVIVKEIDGAHHVRITWFAPSQGTSYSYPFNSPVMYRYPEGASIGAPALLYIEGLSEKVPGAPASAGQAVFPGVVVDIDAGGIPLVITDPDPIKFTGSDGPGVVDRCLALDAP